MLPTALAPLDPHKTRALTTIYAPRKLRTRNNRTATSRMLENDIPVKPTLSPFHPLPAIGQKLERSKTKVILFDLKKDEPDRVKIQEVLKPLTPLRIPGFKKKSLELDKKPQPLIRENTYDVIDPIYLHPNAKEEEVKTIVKDEKRPIRPKISPKSRFKNAALQVAKLSSMPETGKLLCLRERETFSICHNLGDKTVRLERLPRSPEHNMNRLSEIFQTLEMTATTRHRDKMKKENSWF